MYRTPLIPDLPTLANIAEPFADESLDGFLLRIANHNGLNGFRELLVPIPGYSTQQCTATSIHNIAVVVGQTEPKLKALSSSRLNPNSALHDRFYRMRFTPVCPCCIEEHGYAKLIWQHVFVTACPDHNVRLIERCDDCGKTIVKDRTSLKKCECGREFSEIKSEKIGDAERWYNLRLAGRLDPVGSLNDLENDSVEDWKNFQTLIEFLYANQELGTRKVSGTNVKPLNLKATQKIFDYVIPFFENFPNHLSAHIRDRLEAAPVGQTLAAQRLGYWFTRLQRICGASGYPGFLQAAKDAVTEHADGKYFLSDVVANLEKSRFLTLGPAAEYLGTTAETLRKLVASGKIDSISIPHPAASKSIHIEKFQLDKAKAAAKDGLTKVDVMKMTGLGKKSLEYLIEYGLFKKTSTLALELNPLRWLSCKSVESMTEKLQKSVKHGSGPTVALKNFGLRMTTNKAAHRELYLALADGRLKPVNAAGKLGDFEFLLDDVNFLLTSSSEETLLKIAEVSKALKVKDEVIRSWVKQGLLRCVSSSQRGQAVSLIPVFALAEFQAKYVVVSELAKQAGTSSKLILENFEQKKIPTIGSFEISGGAKRGYLVETKNLLRTIN